MTTVNGPTPSTAVNGPTPSTVTEWRGKFDEDRSDDLPIDENLPRRREARALLGSLLRPYTRTLALLALVVVVGNAARLSVPLLVQRGIDRGIPPIIDGGSAHTLMMVVATMGVVVGVQATSRLFFLRRSGRVGQKVLLELRRRVFRHFQRLDIKFHDRYTSGRVVSRSTNDVEAIQDMLETGFDGLITAALTLIGTSILLVTLDVRLGLMCLAAFPILVALVWWFRNESAKIYRKVRESAALVIVQFVETMTGIKAVQAYRREPRNQEIFESVADDYREINEKTFRLLAIFMPGVKLVGNLTTGVVLLYGGYRVLHGEMTIGTLAAFLLYLRMFFEPMQEISQFFNTFQSASSALEKLAGVLAERPGISDPQRPVRLDTVRGDVAFHDVQFSYVEGRPVLPELDFTVPAGQTVALVGTTGAGKTTIAKLIARFYDPASGSVTLDGVDLRDLAQTELRRHVVMVTQENFMFDGTVADNIRFGRPDATDEEVVAAAAAVGADRFIDALPEGYDTDVAKRGGRLSAGQRQLVAFARAFLADPAVLILDEATSSLDIPSERMVQRALETVLADRTALVIAHRLSTVQVADRVLVLEHGRIIEDGTPEDLVGRTDGRYAALHRAWEESLA
ncbi:ABC transporter ATP-binding protein [Mycolicibacterium tusciae]|uniref:ABC transporter ATP-binding protein n=1 Tax=Mycolicibacterium tusciae TaxID=75922 RepID=UPI00024A3179|nr:ABC transporter ATP-binding protein [Mycolicibacterium tusciae]